MKQLKHLLVLVLGVMVLLSVIRDVNADTTIEYNTENMVAYVCNNVLNTTHETYFNYASIILECVLMNMSLQTDYGDWGITSGFSWEETDKKGIVNVMVPANLSKDNYNNSWFSLKNKLSYAGVTFKNEKNKYYDGIHLIQGNPQQLPSPNLDEYYYGLNGFLVGQDGDKMDVTMGFSHSYSKNGIYQNQSSGWIIGYTHENLNPKFSGIESKNNQQDDRLSLLEQWKTTVDNTIQTIQDSITSILNRILVLESYHQTPQSPICDPVCNQFQDCVNGTCKWKPGFCDVNADCELGKVCFNNVCVQEQQQTTVELTPTADTYVYAMAPTANYGAKINLMVKGYTTIPARSFLKFDTSSLGAVQSAKLYVKAYSGSGTVNTQAHFVSDDTWTEAINWNNKPSYDTNVLDTKPVTSGWVVWDVTSALKTDSNGLFSVMLKYANENEQKYNNLYSKEASSDKPYLEVTYS